MRRNTFFSLFFFFIGSLFLTGCGTTTPTSYKINLEIWGVFDDSDAYQSIFNDYREINPFVGQITYRKLSPETYKEDLLNAMASGKGPDIFLLQNTWMSAFQDKVVPAPDSLISEKDFREAFVDVAAEDFISSDHHVSATPLSVDSLALYYNKDLLNAAGITTPPATWEELLSEVSRLTRIDAFGNITQSAVSLGTAYNINRSTDLLLVLAAQLGAGFDLMHFADAGQKKGMEFYTQFARSSSPYYTWNPRLHYSVDAFYEGTTAMMVNYSYQYATLKQKNPKFNFAVAPLPQFASTQPMDFANYWAFAVAKNKTVPDLSSGSSGQLSFPPDRYQDLRTFESWQFLKFLTLPHPSKSMVMHNVLAGTNKEFPLANDPGLEYLKKTNQPAARRDIIDLQRGDVFLSPFALGNLIARSWKPDNPEAAETILAEGIDAVNRGERSVSDALSVIENRLNQFHP